jgi:hypothetical protein
MADIRAYSVATFEGGSVTSDGLVALFRFLGCDNAPLTLAVPHGQLLRLMGGISHASAQAAKIRQHNPSVKQFLPCEKWEFGFSSNDQNLFLTLRVPGGIEISFQLPRSHLSHMRQTLEAMEGRGTDIPPNVRRQ